MNIVSWNCNMAFRKKWDQLLSNKLDLAVIQECENIERLSEALEQIDYNEIIWHGINPYKGIAIISFNNYHIDVGSDFNKSFDFVVPVVVTSPRKKINLFAIWAMPNKGSQLKSYVGQIWQAINYYKNDLKGDTILVGDFNSNAIWDKKRKVGNHSEVVCYLRKYKIESLYHRDRNESHGQEKEATLFLLKNRLKPYHMDYFFVSESLIMDKTQLRIGKHEDWIKLSDHMPVWVDGIFC